MEGYNFRQERERERDAWKLTYLVACMTGTKMSVDEILGRATPAPELTDEQRFAELMKRLGRDWDPEEVPN